MLITSKELFSIVDYKTIYDSLKNLYLNDNDEYTKCPWDKLYEEIKKISLLIKEYDKEYFIEFGRFKDINDNKWYFDIVLKKYKDYENKNIPYSLSFCKWREILSYKIDIGKSFGKNQISPSDAIAVLLWEVSWYGFTENEVNKEINEIIGEK